MQCKTLDELNRVFARQKKKLNKVEKKANVDAKMELAKKFVTRLLSNKKIYYTKSKFILFRRIRNRDLKWYGTLRSEYKEIKMDNEDKLVCDTLFEELQFFVIQDFTELEDIQEKFCLTLMSIPGNEICLDYNKYAISFITNDIVEVFPDTVRKWLAQRHITLM